MIELRKIKKDLLSDNSALVEQIQIIYGDFSGELFSYKYEGEDRWLYRDEKNCTILGLEDDFVVYTSFAIDEDYNIIYSEFDDFSVIRNANNENLICREDLPLADSLVMAKIPPSLDRVYNGMIFHHQVSSKKEEEIVISYKTMYSEKPEYFHSQFTKPYIYSFFTKRKVEKYMLFEAELGTDGYNLITINEFGLGNVLKKGAYNLQKEEKLIRYYKIRWQFSSGRVLLLQPFCVGYTMQEMDKMLEEKGFTRKIEDYMLDYYNGVYLEYFEYNDLAVALKEYDKFHKNKENIKKVSVE